MTRVALVTGSGAGIGADIAKALAQNGYLVAVVDPDEAAAEKVAASIGQAASVAVPCDVSDADQVQAAAARVEATLGSVEVLVNNAGFARAGHLLEMPRSDWDDVIATHLRGSFLFTRALSPGVADRHYGRIINISSISALGDADRVNYVAAKAGLEGLTRAAAADLAGSGITVNAIGPGVIQTNMTSVSAHRARRTLADHLAHQASTIPVRRVGQPHDIARAVLFFAAEDADFITGQTIYIAGGPTP